MKKPKISIDRAYSLFKTSYLKNDGMLDDENFNELMEETIEKGQRVDIQKRVKMGTYLRENYEDEIEFYYDYLLKAERENMEEDMAMEAYYNEKYGR